MYDHRRNRLLVFESELERKVACLLLADHNVVDIYDQPPAVEYTNENGKRIRHTFDFLATFSDGRRVAIAVKPYAKAQAKNFEATLRVIAGQLSRDFAGAIALVTERDLPAQNCRNALLLHSVARERMRDAEAEKAVHVALSAKSETTIGDVVGTTGLKGRAYRALLHLIADGTVSSLARGRLDYNDRIRLTAASEMGAGQ